MVHRETDRKTDKQTGRVHLSIQCLLSPTLEWDQTCLPCSAALKGAVTDMLSQLSPIPPPKSSHRPYPNTMLCLLSPPPHQHSPIRILLTATSSLFRLLFTVKWSPSQSHSAAGLLFISLVLFFPPFLSGWELIWEAQLLVGCPQRTPGHNKKYSGKYSYSLAWLYLC